MERYSVDSVCNKDYYEYYIYPYPDIWNRLVSEYSRYILE